MSHVENARYRILSFKYTPVTSLKKEEPQVEDGSGEAANQNAARPTIKMPAEDLPSLSPLMTSLQEIEDDSAADQGHHPAAIMSDPSEDHGTLRTPAPKAPAPLTEFHFFGDLPAELRLKIWKLTFLPRAVELRSTRPIYSAGHDDGRRPQWQSGCSNPAALSVCIEARELALAHYRIAYPLAALVTSSQEPAATPWSAFSDNNTTITPAPVPAAAAVKGRLLRRTLYISPAADTVCLLGQDSDLARLSGALDSLRAADPLGEGIRRLGLSVRGWGYGGSAVMMRGLGQTVLRDLEQLVLFLYGEHRPPAAWRARGAAWREGDGALERFRREGNGLDLVPIGSSTAYEYKIWLSGKGRQFRDGDGNMMRIGENEIKIMGLEFRTGW